MHMQYDTYRSCRGLGLLALLSQLIHRPSTPPVSHLTSSSQEVTAWPISRPSHWLWLRWPTWDCQIQEIQSNSDQRNNKYFLCGNLFQVLQTSYLKNYLFIESLTHFTHLATRFNPSDDLNVTSSKLPL